jgi:hypothetical protein
LPESKESLERLPTGGRYPLKSEAVGPLPSAAGNPEKKRAVREFRAGGRGIARFVQCNICIALHQKLCYVKKK